jgi:pimeloyl-ACP methyl ester carboxylesterase
VTATLALTATEVADETTPAPEPQATETVTRSVDVTESTVATATVTAETSDEVGRQPLTIHFDDFDAAAELTYPLEGEGPFPTLLLIAGSGVEDMDASICSFGSPEPLSQNFRLIAEELPKHGFAVLRYNKHYVTGPCEADFLQYYTNVDLPLLLEDASLVLAAAQANELVDSDELYLYGWSEGSTIAAALTISNSDAVAGLVLQTPVTLPWYDTFLYQFANVQLPFLREVAEDGTVVPETLLELVSGNAGLVASGGLTYLADPQVMAQNQLALNPFFDTDENGEIDIDSELLPNLRAYMDQLFEPGGVYAIYAEDQALPTVSEQAPLLKQPVLILQGENDANVPDFGAELLDVLLVGNPDHRLLLYPGLGHSLAETESVVADNFGPMAAEPLQDLVDWLRGGGEE